MVFMVCSIVFMLLWCVLFKLTASQPMTNEVHYSLHYWVSHYGLSRARCPPKYTTKEDENSNLILTLEITHTQTLMLILQTGTLGTSRDIS